MEAKPFSITIDFYDSLGKFLRSFLRQIVPDAALDDPVRLFFREFLGIGPANSVSRRHRQVISLRWSVSDFPAFASSV